MLRDLRHAARVLLQAKGWTTVVVISLALGIGANTALFSAINGLLLKRIPVQDPDSLVRLRWSGKNDMVTSSSDYGFSAKDDAGREVRTTFSYPMYKQFLADNRTMTDLLACAPFGRVSVVVDGQAEIADAFLSTGNYYRVLGINASLGRTLVPEDDTPSAPPAAVISARYWRSRFGSDPATVGKLIRINNVPVTIVGVLPPSFTGIQQAVSNGHDVLMPVSLEGQLSTGPAAPSPRVSRPTDWWLQVMGRLKPGATAAQVRGNLEGVFQQTARAGLNSYLSSIPDSERSTMRNRNRKEVPNLKVDSGSRGIYDANTSDKRAVTILSIVVALVLLIVCANVANLLLSRAAVRRKEISVRLSLGATRWRLVRQLLTESLLLASIGGALGIAIGHWGKRLLPGSPGDPTQLDWRVLAFVAAVTGLTGLVFGVAPALRATGVSVNTALKETGRSVIGSRSLLSRILLIVQVAISIVLLVGAGLFLRTLQNLRHVDVGFNAENLVLFRVNPQLNRYDDQRTRSLYDQLLERLRAVPGVKGAAGSNPALLSGSVNSTGIFVQGRTYTPESVTSINRLVVTPGFFEMMEIPILIGRGLTTRDDENAPKVLVINEAAVRKYFPGESPIGKRVGNSPEENGQFEIVGIARDVKYNSVRDSAPPTMFVPYRQSRGGSIMVEVRTAGAPTSVMTAIRETVRQIDPNLPVMDMSTQMEQIERRFLQERVFANAYLLFGGLALALAAIGIFGLMSYSVARRTNEIGIRMALGARSQDVLRLIMRESMILVAVGVVIGVAIALGTSRFVASLLFGLPPTDLFSMCVAMIVMIAVSAFAGYLPARRASRVDPMVALHQE
ncbi:MAG TPA: ABC transporter permease [Vicinamibacterales bacterium]|jgi:predicted permease|nr:ABC transporter permease [Vicinamibacterales bacterium]